MKLAEWKERVGALPCVLCTYCGVEQQGRTYIHHCRTGQGMSERASDYLGIALCWEHHQGNSGVHKLGPNGIYLRWKIDELDLLAMTIEAVWRGL